MIEDDDRVILREMRDLLPPAGRVAAATVGQHDSGTLAMYLVVYTRPICLDLRYAGLLIRFQTKEDR